MELFCILIIADRLYFVTVQSIEFILLVLSYSHSFTVCIHTQLVGSHKGHPRCKNPAAFIHLYMLP